MPRLGTTVNGAAMFGMASVMTGTHTARALRVRGAIAMLCAGFVLSGCSDPGAPLPGGYFIFKASSSEIYLNEPKFGGSIPKLVDPSSKQPLKQ